MAINKETKKQPPMFSVEGIDGAGKSTQIPLVQAELGLLGYTVKLLKSPSASLLGEFVRLNVRKLTPWLRNQLFMLDMKAEVEDTANLPGEVLLWDRYIDSFYTSNKEMSLTEAEALVQDMRKPDRTFWLDVDPEEVFKNRPQAVDHHSDPEWLALKVRRYRELRDLYPDRILRIDGALSVPEVTPLIVHGMLQIIKGYE